ncbi:MAG: hypothetical protein DHS20C15_22120 [Planctomycetota bacterium]|nr:MAG: hypothetical protein DHS20C15_22120 [Planctomycetota bacterium]
MSPLLPLCAALGACLLGPLAGVLLALSAWLARWGARAALGLALLGLAGGARSPETLRASSRTGSAEPAGRDAAGPDAARLTARWEAQPGDRALLHTAAGPLFVDVAGDLPEIRAGTVGVALLRGSAKGRPRVVSFASSGARAGLWWARAREAVTERLGRLLRRSQRGLLIALLLGQRHEMHPASLVDARRTGTAHLLALSGLHVVLLARMLRGASQSLLLSGRGFECAGLGVFACLAGGRMSLWRATLGRLLARAGDVHGSGPGALHRLLSVAVLLAVWRPDGFALLGTQLSFLAVAGLLAMSRLLPGGVWQALAPAGAFLVTAPLAADIFGAVAPIGLLLTPLLVPALSALLGLGLLAVFLGLFGPACDSLLTALLAPLNDAVIWMLELFAQWAPAPLAPRPLPLPALLASGLVLAALLVLAQFRPERDRLLARAS